MTQPEHQRLLIVDFGSQVTQLIARRLREARIYCEIHPYQKVDAGFLDAFGPQVLVSQHGCDSHALDPLAHMALTVDAQRIAAECLHRWAHDYADCRWIATGGGGYAIVDVVPRTWTHVMAEMSGSPVDPNSRVPEDWRAYVAARLGAVAPLRMTDGASPKLTDWSSGYDPADSVDRSIMATRKAVFPLHGLDPERD